MKFSTSLSSVLALSGTTLAATLPKRATGNVTDVDVLNYALTLEHLEDKFYRDGLANFTQKQFADAGFDATFYQNLKEISYDETTHVTFLTTALKAAGASPVMECKYAFGVNSVASFVATASVLEGVGVSAYLGAAASISTKAYLTAAASILTVESRHNAYLRAALKESPFAQPFDTPLDFDEVYTLASAFITSCPSNNPPFLASLPLKAFTALSASGTAPIKTGSTITLTLAKLPAGWDGKQPLYAAWAAVTGSTFTPVKCLGHGKYQVVVPAGFHGQSYVVLTTNGTDSSDGNIVAGPAIVEISGSNGML
ncbi:ferritin-like domain-containing protein [Venturia nashicola]|uniref:Ferritin-like domain-containing protein n=1 Tax=Venturia nashicola TaxID=86259 RepID=A0A4Z1P5D7_9PEZI|nr:ferritin-like domain-containing protein [Venturia nashicola]TLD36708.1 ferritin-like domain-containing protein [Venturia nashicola]